VIGTTTGEWGPLLERARRGDEGALGAAVPLAYDELRRLAGSHLRRERPGHSLDATALVHELYLRLARQGTLSWESRAHFFGIAARAMRQILVERARARGAEKRGGGLALAELDSRIAAVDGPLSATDLLDLNDALNRLQATNADLARVVELRFFAGLSVEEAAEAIGVAPATLKRRWSLARAWLFRELQGNAP